MVAGQGIDRSRGGAVGNVVELAEPALLAGRNQVPQDHVEIGLRGEYVLENENRLGIVSIAARIAGQNDGLDLAVKTDRAFHLLECGHNASLDMRIRCIRGVTRVAAPGGLIHKSAKSKKLSKT